jgi:hypothetical protein
MSAISGPSATSSPVRELVREETDANSLGTPSASALDGATTGKQKYSPMDETCEITRRRHVVRHLDQEDVQELRQKIPSRNSWFVLQSVLTMLWSGLGDKGNKNNRDVFRSKYENLGLIHALLLGVAAGAVFSGDFVVFQDDIEVGSWHYYAQKTYLFVWCAAFLNFLYAMVMSCMYVLAMNETNSESQFEHFEHMLGPFFLELPYIMLHTGSFLVWLGLIAFVILTYNFHFMLCCLGTCSAFLFLFHFASMRMAQALHSVHTIQEALDVKRVELGPDEIYEELRHYWQEECGQRFSRLSRSFFLNRFECSESESIIMLAVEIYDNFFRQKVQGMLRDDSLDRPIGE